jgi:hypothetical protein
MYDRRYLAVSLTLKGILTPIRLITSGCISSKILPSITTVYSKAVETEFMQVPEHPA